jgi:hypothetical protein
VRAFHCRQRAEDDAFVGLCGALGVTALRSHTAFLPSSVSSPYEIESGSLRFFPAKKKKNLDLSDRDRGISEHGPLGLESGGPGSLNGLPAKVAPRFLCFSCQQSGEMIRSSGRFDLQGTNQSACRSNDITKRIGIKSNRDCCKPHAFFYAHFVSSTTCDLSRRDTRHSPVKKKQRERERRKEGCCRRAPVRGLSGNQSLGSLSLGPRIGRIATAATDGDETR